MNEDVKFATKPVNLQRICNLNLTKIRDRASRFLVMTFAFRGWPCSWRRRRWRWPHARGRAHHDRRRRRRRWRGRWRRLAAPVRVAVSHLCLRCHQHRLAPGPLLLLVGVGPGAPTVQHPDSASHVRLKLGALSRRVSHFQALTRAFAGTHFVFTFFFHVHVCSPVTTDCLLDNPTTQTHSHFFHSSVNPFFICKTANFAKIKFSQICTHFDDFVLQKLSLLHSVSLP